MTFFCSFYSKNVNLFCTFFAEPEVLGIKLEFAKPLKSDPLEGSVIFITELGEFLVLMRMEFPETSVYDISVAGGHVESDKATSLLSLGVL